MYFIDDLGDNLYIHKGEYTLFTGGGRGGDRVLLVLEQTEMFYFLKVMISIVNNCAKNEKKQHISMVFSWLFR